MAIIRTVLEDIPAADVGITLTHEHIRYAYPGTESDHRNAWDFETVAEDIAAVMRKGANEYGYRTVVDLTPAELGRHPELMAEVQRRSGMRIIATTGFFPESQGLGILYHWRKQTIDYVEDMLLRDLTEGMVFAGNQTPYKAGIIKCATGTVTSTGQPTPEGPNGRRIGVFEDRVIRAAAHVQAKTGCCINTHTQPIDYNVTNPGLEMIDLLEEEGADPTKVIIGHALINPQVEQLIDICKRGGNIQVDHIGIPWQHSSADELDDLMVHYICLLADAGYLDRVVISYDRFFHHSRGPVTDAEPEQLNELVDFGYLFESFIPRLTAKGFGDDEVAQVLIENPKRLLAF
jgi:phosphotriesterase-related protein